MNKNLEGITRETEIDKVEAFNNKRLLVMGGLKNLHYVLSDLVIRASSYRVIKEKNKKKLIKEVSKYSPHIILINATYSFKMKLNEITWLKEKFPNTPIIVYLMDDEKNNIKATKIYSSNKNTWLADDVYKINGLLVDHAETIGKYLK
ncbi:MAG: hypothetical protein QXG00_01555 [Candidatus Woesearchaeota archaeon]